jgi:hypothetical protein
MKVKYYINEEGLKCVDLNVEETCVVDIKGWSRIIQYSNRDLVVKTNNRLNILDENTGNVVAVYDDELDMKNNNKKAVRRRARENKI